MVLVIFEGGAADGTIADTPDLPPLIHWDASGVTVEVGEGEGYVYELATDDQGQLLQDAFGRQGTGSRGRPRRPRFDR